MTEQETSNSLSYWLGLFTVHSWQEFLKHGGEVMGFNLNKLKSTQKLAKGDRIIGYLSKVSAFVAVLEVTGDAYVDDTPIWSDGVFPVRVPVRVLISVPFAQSVAIKSLAGKLSFLPSRDTRNWSIHVRTAPKRWNFIDGRHVEDALRERGAGSSNEAISIEIAKHTPTKPPFKSKKSSDSRVGQLIVRSQKLFESRVPTPIGSYESVLSFNKVTGYSVNYPIALTCKPTATCLQTCYFSKGPSSWQNALLAQQKIYEATKRDPEFFAQRVAMEYDRLQLSFIRWNGGGDLFPESVQAINYLGRVRPDIFIWVVTRIPELAAQIEEAESVYVHFSLDRHSWSRQKKFESLPKKTKKYFYSYQCEPKEIPDPKKMTGVSVLFFDEYVPTTDLDQYQNQVVCPLNETSNIRGTCQRCRRCFDGEAVRWREDVDRGHIDKP